MSRWVTRPEPYGLLLRLLLMPFGAMMDLFGYYWLSHRLVYHGELPVDQLGGYLAVWPPYYLHAAWLWVIRPLMGVADPWGEGLVATSSLDPFWIGPGALEAFYTQLGAQRLWALFLLKLPYALGELYLVKLLIRRTVRGTAARRRISWFLWLNPVTLFFVYLCGTWDVLPVALMIGALVLLERRLDLAGLCFSVAVIMKVFPLILLPFVVLLGARAGRDRVMLGVSIVLPLLLFLLLGAQFGIAMSDTALKLPHYGMLVGAVLHLQPPHDRLYPFLVGYMLLFFHAARYGQPSFEGLVRYSTAVLLGFYSLAFFHPQYFFWCIPLLAVLVAQDRGLLWLFGLQVAALGAYLLQFGPTFTTQALAPLNPGVLFHVRAPLEWLSGVMNPGLFVGLAHSGLAGVSLWMLYVILRGAPGGRRAASRVG